MNGIELLPIKLDHIAVVSSLPLHHRDPFDRLLIAQSVGENIPLLSADEIFDAYPIQRVW
jgi:PIN domain nuclease of toxin-antitoxin system